MDTKKERAAIAVCQVLYPEAWANGQTWGQFPLSTQETMRRAACAAVAAATGAIATGAADIPSPEESSKVAPNRAVVDLLVKVASTAFLALEDSEEREGEDGRIHVLDSSSFDALSNALDALDQLPDDRPGYTMGPAQKAEWALRHSVTLQPSAKALTFADGIEAAAKWVDKRREDHDSEFGAADPDTGTFEFCSVTHEEYSAELYEVAEGIRALPAAAQPCHQDGHDAVRFVALMGAMLAYINDEPMTAEQRAIQAVFNVDRATTIDDVRAKIDAARSAQEELL